MISIPLHARCMIRVPPTDFRCGIDALVKVTRSVFQENPFTGTVFVFINRKHTAVKLLYYDGQGWWLALKRLSQGRLKWWPKTGDPSIGAQQISARELQVLIWNGNPIESRFASDWRKIEPQLQSSSQLI